MIESVRKYVKHIATSIFLHLKERTFRANGTRIKYLEFSNGGVTDALVIVFSAYNNEKALYNYVRTLSDIKVKRLYLKDDFAPNRKGSYYLGEKGKHNVEATVIDLIKHQMKKYGLTDNSKLLFVGSSKGGYAALNFAAEFDNSFAIVGAPQYLLGRHLNEEFFFPMLEDIIGTRTKEKIDDLDNHVRNKYIHKSSNMKQSIYLQYSDKEYGFEKHIKYLIEDLKKTNIDVHYECLDYKEHSDVHKYFPAYLHKNISSIIKSQDGD